MTSCKFEIKRNDIYVFVHSNCYNAGINTVDKNYSILYQRLNRTLLQSSYLCFYTISINLSRIYMTDSNVNTDTSQYLEYLTQLY